MRSDGARRRKLPFFLVCVLFVQLAVVDIGTGEGLLCLVSSLLSLICVGRLFGSYGLQTDIKELLVNELGMAIVCKGGPCCAIKWGAAR